MIIESINIKNFLSHEDTEINFEQGVNIITGKNGAGKSSILDAMKFALFGESRNNEKINELIKKGKNFFEITLNFNLNGDHYEIYRHFGMKKAKNAERLAYVKKNGVFTSETYEGVNAEITKILNVSKDVFKNSVFVEQGQMDSLISGTPKERKTIFSDIIGLTSLSKSADRLKEIASNFRDEASTLQSSSDRLTEIRSENIKLNEDYTSNINLMEEAEKEANRYLNEFEDVKKKQKERDKIKLNIDNLKSNIEQYSNEILVKERNITELNEDIKKLQSERERLEKLQSDPYYIKKDAINKYFVEKKEFDNYSIQLRKANDRINYYNEILEKANGIQEYHNEYSNYMNKYNSNNDKIKKYTNSHEEYIKIEGNIKALSARLDKRKISISKFIESYGITMEELNDLRTIREDIRKQILDKSENLSEIKSKVISYSKEIKETRESMDALNGKSKCPLCGTPLTPEHINSISEEYNNKINAILKENEKLGSEKNKIEIEKKKLEEKYNIFASSEAEDASSYIGEINSIEAEKSEEEQKLRKIEDIQKLFMELYNENNEIEKKLKDIKLYEDEYNRYTSIISSIDKESINNDIIEINTSISASKEEIDKCISEIGFVPDYSEYNKKISISSDIDKLKTDLRHMDEMKIKINSINNEIIERRNMINELKNKIETYNNELEKYDDIDANVDEMEKLYVSAKQDTAKFKTLADSCLRQIKENQEIENKLEHNAEKYKKLNDAIIKLGKIRDAFDYNGIQAMIRKDASASMTNLTRKYLQSFNLDFDDIAIDENFDIKVTQNSMEQTLESLSGGEKTALAIAIRLSVTEYVLDRISTIIMDEPTNFLDEDRRNNLKDIILYSLKGENIVPQMIMITHHSELISVADASFEIIKDKGTSHVVES